MNRTREISRLRWPQKEGVRPTPRALGLGHGVLSEVTSRAVAAGPDWVPVEAMEDAELEQRLYGLRAPAGPQRPEPD